MNTSPNSVSQNSVSQLSTGAQGLCFRYDAADLLAVNPADFKGKGADADLPITGTSEFKVLEHDGIEQATGKLINPRWIDDPEMTDLEEEPLPPAREDIKHTCLGEWDTADGFSINARFRPAVIRHSDTRKPVDLKSLSQDVQRRLYLDVGKAVSKEFGWDDYVLRSMGELHDAKRADFWQAFSDGKRVNFTRMEILKEPETVIELLQRLEFNPHKEPPPLRTVYSILGTTISTPGNITTITSAVKTGKTAVVSAMAGSAIPHSDDSDFLGFESSNENNFALLWFDPEQSPDDFWHCVHRAIRRAGLQKPPPWLHAFCVTGQGYLKAWNYVTEAVKFYGDKHGGLHSIILDGVADFIADVNDAGESNDFVARLQNMAIENDCPITGVIHFNPGSDKSRGHLGSQLERKAETNLTLKKNKDESTVIYSTKNRRAGIPEHLGPCFKFDVDAGMHLLSESRQSSRDAADTETLQSLAEELFADHPAMRFSELQITVKNRLTVSDKTAERKVARMVKLAVIKKSIAGFYTLSTPAASK